MDAVNEPALNAPDADPAEGPGSASARPHNYIARAIVSVVLIGLIGAAATAGFMKLKSLKPPTRRDDVVALPILVRALPVKREDHVENLRGYGVSEALRRSEAVAMMDGRVVEVAADLDVGQAVRPKSTNGSGSPEVLPIIARLDDRDIRDRAERASLDVEATRLEIERLAAQHTNLEGRIELAREEKATSQREYERIKPLVPKTLSPSDLDRQRLQVTLQERRIRQLEGSLEDNQRQAKVAAARVAAARKTVELEERLLEWTVIRAPSTGVVQRRAIEPSDFIRRGDVVLELVDLSHTQIPISLSASRYEDVKPGTHVTLFDPVTNAELWSGPVTRRSPAIDTTSRTFRAFVEIKGTPYENPIPPGRHVRAQVRGRTQHDVVVAPRQAFLDDMLYVAVRAKPTFWTPQRAWLAGLPHTENTVYEVEVRKPDVARWLPGVGLVTEGLANGDWLLLTNLESVGAGGSVRVTFDAQPESLGQPATRTD